MSAKNEQEVIIPTSKGPLKGILHIPKEAKAVVIFAHGSGSGRLSPRNQFVAKKLQEANLATLLMDLLTREEEAIDEITRELRFDIELLAKRLVEVTTWAKKEPTLAGCRVGYFGASTGAAAALLAASMQEKGAIYAIVSRGGRPDLAMPVLPTIEAPVLLLVGGYDDAVIELNRKAFMKLGGKKSLEIIPKATHLFEEPGTLELVATNAALWFSQAE
jgi:putative phosphoribosyl transferase